MKTRYFLIAVLWWHIWRRACWSAQAALAQTMYEHHEGAADDLRRRLFPPKPYEYPEGKE